MGLSIGIVGLPNVGKSTLFNALTRKSVPAENYPFCTIDPSVGIVPVPDDRLYQLAKISNSEEIIPAVVEFVDIAGLVKGASLGEGLGNKFLQHIREVDAIAQVVRIFEDEKITHVSGKVDPVNDIETINLELIMADLETVNKRISNLSREVKRGDKEAVLENNVLEKIRKCLTEGKLASTVDLIDEEEIYRKNLHLLSAKPMLYVLNRKNNKPETDTNELNTFLSDQKANFVIVDAGVEQELSELEEQDKKEFKKELAIEDDGISNLIKTSYNLLGLISYFTTGEKETRSWTIKNGSTAPVAGMAIHTDFKDKFIKAEIIHCSKLIEVGSYTKARELGLIRTEGKEYIVKDGDVVEFKI